MGPIFSCWQPGKFTPEQVVKPCLGKDVILLILHRVAATDYKSFCNVRLVAKWVAKSMDIATNQKWRHMVEDAALERVTADGNDFRIEVMLNGVPSKSVLCHSVDHREVRFIRQADGTLEIVVSQVRKHHGILIRRYVVKSSYVLVARIYDDGCFHVLVDNCLK